MQSMWIYNTKLLRGYLSKLRSRVISYPVGGAMAFDG